MGVEVDEEVIAAVHEERCLGVCRSANEEQVHGRLPLEPRARTLRRAFVETNCRLMCAGEKTGSPIDECSETAR